MEDARPDWEKELVEREEKISEVLEQRHAEYTQKVASSEGWKLIRERVLAVFHKHSNEMQTEILEPLGDYVDVFTERIVRTVEGGRGMQNAVSIIYTDFIPIFKGIIATASPRKEEESVEVYEKDLLAVASYLSVGVECILGDIAHSLG